MKQVSNIPFREIIQELEAEGVRNVLSMKLEGDKWIIVYGEEGSNRILEKHVKCIPFKSDDEIMEMSYIKGGVNKSSRKSKITKSYYHTAPPSEETMDVAFFTTKALNEETGVVTNIEFKENRWFVTLTDGIVDTELVYKPEGQLEYKFYTD